MSVIVTCGPSSEPLDEVRRFTNFSTGELGLLLARRLSLDFDSVLCCRGTGSTHAGSAGRATILPFNTNQELKELLCWLARKEEVTAIFHAAALCDFVVASLRDAEGNDLRGAKISSRSGEITLKVKTTEKLITQLRAWYPRSLLIGWKYELEGSRAEVVARGERQLRASRSDACVLNGRAYVPGFGFYENGQIRHTGSKQELVEVLSQWLQERVKQPVLLTPT